MNELALFAGAAGGILGGLLLGWRTVCAVEIDDYCRRVLMQRQDDGILDPFPIWDDVRTFDGKPWRGVVDVVSGGFPCQDISAAGRGAGINGERSGLWSEMARIIGEVRPRFVFVENSPMLVTRGLERVLSDLAALGYDATWGVIGAHHAGAPHKRDRIWIVADDTQHGWRQGRKGRSDSGGEGEWKQPLSDVANAEGALSDASEQIGPGGQNGSGWRNWSQGDANRAGAERTLWWEFEPDVGRVANGVASRVDRLRSIGNGQVPAVVRLAWETLT